MRQLSQIDQVTFADLVQKSLDAEFDATYPENGTFVRQRRRGRDYWYYRGYAKKPDGSSGERYMKYVGPSEDPDIQTRVERFARNKVSYRIRRELASKLRSAGLPSPTRLEGQILDTLARAGIFRLRAVLVGSIAYQTYAGTLGVRLADSLIRTGDADFAQFYSISQQIDDRVDDLEAALKSVDATFQPMFHGDSSTLVPGFISAAGFKVEFLTPNRGDQAYENSLAQMPALGTGIGAQVMRFLDFLIKDPIRTVVLHEAGVPVTVPQPARYAVHKLIVTTMRSSGTQAKISKDISQVADLLEAFALTRREADVGFAWIEAWERGASWRRRLMRASLRLSDEHLAMLDAGVDMAARLEGLDPEKFGVVGGRTAVLNRLSANGRQSERKSPG